MVTENGRWLIPATTAIRMPLYVRLESMLPVALAL